MTELDEVQFLRLKLKGAKHLIRDLLEAVARCEEALERANNAQPEEAQRDSAEDEAERYCAA